MNFEHNQMILEARFKLKELGEIPIQLIGATIQDMLNFKNYRALDKTLKLHDNTCTICEH